MAQNTPKDWHNAMIVARLRMAGTSLRQLSTDNDLYPTALSIALQRPWLKAEGIIAGAIGVEAKEIWPARYAHRDAKRQRRKGALKAPAASIGQCSHDCNINVKEVA
jgi:Ner family transcriptional regulator